MAEVEPKFESINGHDPKALILSVNINRRHMSAGQRAMAMIYPEPLQRGRGNKATKDLESKSFSSARLSQARPYRRSMAGRVSNTTQRLKRILGLPAPYFPSSAFSRRSASDATCAAMRANIAGAAGSTPSG